MHLNIFYKSTIVCCVFIFISHICLANEDLYNNARLLQKEMKYNEAIEAYKSYLTQPIAADNLSASELSKYTQALVQLMNLYQSKGEPQECISALKEVYTASAILQKELLRDYYSVMGYALSRTENMKEAEQMMLKAFTVQLHKPTPERYFRDYAYAAAVFYSNPSYQNEVTYWCEEALRQSQLSENKSGL